MRRNFSELIGRNTQDLRNHKLLVKVQGGTRPSGKRLCDTCKNGLVMTGRADSNELVYCHEMGEYVPIEVTSCSAYKNKTEPSLHDMKMIAWQLRTEKNGRSIGFVSPAKYRELQRENGINPYDDDFDDE